MLAYARCAEDGDVPILGSGRACIACWVAFCVGAVGSNVRPGMARQHGVTRGHGMHVGDVSKGVVAGPCVPVAFSRIRRTLV